MIRLEFRHILWISRELTILFSRVVIVSLALAGCNQGGLISASKVTSNSEKIIPSESKIDSFSFGNKLGETSSLRPDCKWKKETLSLENEARYNISFLRQECKYETLSFYIEDNDIMFTQTYKSMFGKTEPAGQSSVFLTLDFNNKVSPKEYFEQFEKNIEHKEYCQASQSQEGVWNVRNLGRQSIPKFKAPPLPQELRRKFILKGSAKERKRLLSEREEQSQKTLNFISKHYKIHQEKHANQIRLNNLCNHYPMARYIIFKDSKILSVPIYNSQIYLKLNSIELIEN